MIKNLIFDVGGVLIGYRCLELFMELGKSREEAEELARKVFDSGVWSTRMDMGYLSVEEAISALGELFPKEREDIAWFLRNGDRMAVPRPEIWEKVLECKRRGYRIYLLSNYSEELFHKHTDGAAFWQAVDGEIISYQVHCIKPDERIYMHLLNKYELNPEECCFYDDRAENVETANRLGMKGVLVESEEKLGNLIDKNMKLR